MDYATARSQIKDGDLIGVRDVHGLLGHATTLLTYSPYTHTGVAVWLDDPDGPRLFMADLNSGRNHLTALSCLEKFDVCDPPAGIERKFIRTELFNWLAKPITYGFLAFIVIGLKCALKLKTFIHWRKIVVCSGGSVQIYQLAGAAMGAAGIAPPQEWVDHNQMIAPGELVSELSVKFGVGY